MPTEQIDLLALVRDVVPAASEEDCEALLMNCTAFPFAADMAKVKAQLAEAYEKGGRTVNGAMDWAHCEIMRQVEMAKEAGVWPS